MHLVSSTHSNIMNRCYQIMSGLPAVPVHLVRQAMTIANNYSSTTDKKKYPTVNAGKIDPLRSKTYINEQGQQVVGRNGPRFEINQEWNQWVRENIAKDFNDTGVSVSLLASQDQLSQSNDMKAHADSSRNFGLLYLVHKSNDDQWTRWYQEIGQSVIRPKGTYGENMANLLEIDSICIPLNTWIYMDVRILHRAENIKGSRVSLMISLDHDQFGVFNGDNV